MKQIEITRFASLFGVPNSTIDKDWVLGHLLNAIFGVHDKPGLLIFKGGTCLRKCWFQDYRFSEDLDFTLLDKRYPISDEWIKPILKKTGELSGAKFQLESLTEQRWKDIPQGYLIDIKFWGADHHPNQKPLPSSRWQTHVHIDINYTEPLLENPVIMNILHPYSDKELITNQVVTYSFEELFAEKIRTLQQRNRPRDIYDVGMLCRHLKDTDLGLLAKLFIKKCQVKSLAFDNLSRFVNPKKERINQRHWDRALQYQVNREKLPEFISFYQEVGNFIKTLIIQSK
ncbi:MAG: nucleotidyl transferase AbiEii/AbiGii toxin family protein [Bacteroidota bacterium]